MRVRLQPIVLLLLLNLSPLLAEESKPGYYYRPEGFIFKPGDEQLSCTDLDREIALFEPHTYSYKPKFYEDPLHGGSLLGGSIFHPALYAYLPYSAHVEYQEHERILQARRRIAVLRQLKAYQRCYED
ncbi:hypothetical protein [endosymbiont of Ridgeia piscesae]|jgi:hypothetical protein|uniref:Uncharacterized protein n=1 Tax=endosymbiont of Ridgeia piscesae TaxID=54398 RepID=A0A0T5YWJ5_9GAMM|nr:hypothetical protein [endosymbiont of Ridgeia piscesae]KRT54895.1 hypothetical protein Ga0074115_11118 [endosymbiont of Ridgeia piscesae]KRT58675.1 hypothetical protein Ga0076813_139313 [endosymbiont of Ridgeia piscesae]